MTIKEEIVIASHNSGKILELKSLLQPYFPRIQSSKELNLISPIESGKSFKENAEIKSLSAARESKIISISDDSGLVIDALNGMPGIYSARWAGIDKNFDLAMEKVENKLFHCTAGLILMNLSFDQILYIRFLILISIVFSSTIFLRVGRLGRITSFLLTYIYCIA